MSTAQDKLNLARRHPGRVLKLKTSKKHWVKADVAGTLRDQHGLPDVEKLLRDLNEARKAAAYGDVPVPDLDAEGVASQIESYVDAVAAVVERES